MNFMRSFEYSPVIRSFARLALNFKILPAHIYLARAKMSQYTIDTLQKWVDFKSFDHGLS